jgi:carbamoylphosphate synthase large subunit
MKKVLLLDTNVSSFPIYNFLVENGYEVYVAGSKPNDCLAKYTDNYINIDYSNLYFLEDLIDTYDFDFLVPGCNDMSYISATKANDKNKFYGLDTTEVSEIINNKSKFRKFAIDKNLNVPIVYSNDEVYGLDNPIIIKPVDAYSGRGVSVIKNPKETDINLAIENAINYSNTKKYLIEEYIDGQLYSHTTFISDKKIIIDFIVIEHGTKNEFTVDTSNVVHDFPENTLKEIREQIEYIAEKLNLVDGLIHTQFIKTKNSFKIIEVTRRCPGDLYSLLIQKSTNFDYTEFYTSPFIDKKYEKKQFQIEKNKILRHTISFDETKNFIGVSYENDVNIDLEIPLSITGDLLQKAPFGRISIVFFRCKSDEELNEMSYKLIQKKLYKIYGL